MILGKNFKFYKIEIFSGVVIATPANARWRCNCDAGVAIAAPTGLIKASLIIIYNLLYYKKWFVYIQFNSPVGVAITTPENISIL